MNENPFPVVGIISKIEKKGAELGYVNLLTQVDTDYEEGYPLFSHAYTRVSHYMYETVYRRDHPDAVAYHIHTRGLVTGMEYKKYVARVVRYHCLQIRKILCEGVSEELAHRIVNDAQRAGSEAKVTKHYKKTF